MSEDTYPTKVMCCFCEEMRPVIALDSGERQIVKHTGVDTLIGDPDYPNYCRVTYICPGSEAKVSKWIRIEHAKTI